jgi:hypothetical protein
MAELSLPACPICTAPDSLFHRRRESGGKAYTWYECRACGSVLLDAGGGQYIYRKVGRQDSAHLLRQRLTLDDLEALLPSAPEGSDLAADTLPATPPSWHLPEAERPTLPAMSAMPPPRARQKEDLPTVTVGLPRAGEERPSTPDARDLPTVEAYLPTVTVGRDVSQELRGQTPGRSPPPRLFVWLVGLCLIAFLVLVAFVVYQLVIGSPLF